MVYKTGSIDLKALFGPVTDATAALTRLDERLARSPVRDGWIERQHFADAAAVLWLEGELVHVEDLVLHDAHMDIRMPTHELTRAHAVLRARRQIANSKAGWALSAEGLRQLTRRGSDGVEAGRDNSQGPRSPELAGSEDEANPVETDPASTDELDKAMHAIDAVLQRSGKVIEGHEAERRTDSLRTQERPELVYDHDWDENARLGEWLEVVAQTKALPRVMCAAILIDAWGEIEVLQHGSWLGPLLTTALLRQEGLAGHHLPCWSIGAKQIPRERRRALDRTHRLLAFVDAIGEAAKMGLKEHDRLVQARGQMERRLQGKRKNSKLPDLIELALSRPLITAPLVSRDLKVSFQGALNLVIELGLREVTGRGRFRAWSFA